MRAPSLFVTGRLLGRWPLCRKVFDAFGPVFLAEIRPGGPGAAPPTGRPVRHAGAMRPQ
ncbi:hypothetical protein roselon_00105 [Roseibacterium elongatum DSM 19469]|uniref:Uncharacterized protein n=1 Tax=Roseicyclus elongatus DSM 19469 TaxID=1294273 RepID=W8RN61_9RHOB|nr:hypothetical protein roselon_00105 [Roseibacterium elongatum DSM 19469]